MSSTFLPRLASSPPSKVVALFAALLTWLVPAGSFQTHEITYLAEGVEKSRTVIEPGSFKIARDAAGNEIYNRATLFESGGGAGFLNFVFESLVSVSKWGSAIGVIMFMLVIGGAFGVIMRTGTIDNGILRLIEKTRQNQEKPKAVHPKLSTQSCPPKAVHPKLSTQSCPPKAIHPKLSTQSCPIVTRQMLIFVVAMKKLIIPMCVSISVTGPDLSGNLLAFYLLFPAYW